MSDLRHRIEKIRSMKLPLGKNNPQTSSLNRTVKCDYEDQLARESSSNNVKLQRIVRIFQNNKLSHESELKKTGKFVSRDDMENLDNDDPGWDKLRKLKDIAEFKRYANAVFGNKNVNPNVCMSHHGFKKLQNKILSRRRKRFGLATEIRPNNVNAGDKRKLPDPEQMPIIKRCKIGLMNFQVYVTKLCQALADHKLLKEYNWLSSYYLNGCFWQSKCGIAPGKPLAERNWRYTIRHFIHSMEETESLYRAMCCDQKRVIGNGSNLTISYSELEKVIDLERLFGQFVRFYGPNEEINCKWCGYLEGQKVWHPY